MPNIHMADEGYIREQRNWANAQRSVSQGVTRAGMFIAGLTDELRALEDKRQRAKDEVDAVSYMNGLRDVTNKFMIENKDNRDYKTIQDKYTEAVNKYHDDFKMAHNPTEDAFKMIDRQALNYVGNMRVNVTNKAMKNDSMFQVSRVQAVNTDLLQKASLDNAEADFASYKRNQQVLWQYQGKPADEVVKLQDETFKRQYMVSSYSKIIADTPVDAVDNSMWRGNDLLTAKDKRALDIELQRRQNDQEKERRKYVKERADVVYDSLRHGEPVSPSVFDDIAKYDKKYAYGLQQMYDNVTKNATKSGKSVAGLNSMDRQTLARINMALDDETLPLDKKIETIQKLSTELNLPTGVNKFMEMIKTHNDVTKMLDSGEKSDLNNMLKAIDEGFGVGLPEGKDAESKYARIKETPNAILGSWWISREYDSAKSIQAANDVKVHVKNVALMLKTAGKPVTIDVLKQAATQYMEPYLKDMTRDQIMRKAQPWKPYPFGLNPSMYAPGREQQPQSPQRKQKNGVWYVLGKDGKYYREK